MTKSKKRKGNITLPVPAFLTGKNTFDSEQLVTDFIEYKQASRAISSSMVRAYKTYLTSLMEAGADALIESRDSDGLASFVLHWLSEPMKKAEDTPVAITNGTWNRKLAYVKSFLNYLIEEKKFFDVNPLRRIRKRHEDIRMLPFGTDAVGAISKILLDQYIDGSNLLDLRNYLLFTMLYTAGLRVGEAGAFSRQQIDLQSGTITIYGRITKTKTSRMIPIPLFVAGAKLKQKSDYQKLFEYYYNYHAGKYPAGTPFFCTSPGGKFTATNIYHTLKPFFVDAGIPQARIHDLRHYALTSLAINGGSAVVQAIAGHASSTTTERYINPTPAIICKIAAKIINSSLGAPV